MQITVNGQQYDSWDDVPEDIRTTMAASGALPDSDHNGVPDLFEHPDQLPPGAARVIRTGTVIDVGGKTYDSADELPPDIRAALAQAGLLGGPQPRSGAQAGPQSGPPPASAADQPTTGTTLNGVPIAEADKPRRRWWRRS